MRYRLTPWESGTICRSSQAVAPREVTDAKPAESPDEVERVVRELNKICKKATLDFALAVGSVIIQTFYGGRLLEWRTRGPKAASFRRLAKHPNLPMSPSALYRCVAIYEICERLGLRHCRHVSSSHIRLVVALPSHTQERLLTTAEREYWTVARMRNEVIILKRSATPVASRGGRKPAGRLNQTMRTLIGCIDTNGNLVGSGERDLDLSPESTRCILEVMDRVGVACNRLRVTLRSPNRSRSAEFV